jgi:hypothetical protein
LALSCPVPQGMELGAECFTEWGRDGRAFLREFEARVAQAAPEARAWTQGPQTLGGAVEAISEDPFDPIGRLPLPGGALKRAIGLRKGHRTGLRGITQMPAPTPTDYGRQVHCVGQTRAVLLIGEKIEGQGETTPGQDRHQTVAAARTDQAIERHRRNGTDPPRTLPN